MGGRLVPPGEGPQRVFVLGGLRAARLDSAARGAAQAALVIDCHAHLTHHSRPDYLERDWRLIEAADKLGIDRLCCSILKPRRPATAEGFRQCNRWVAEAMKRFRGRVLGYCYVNPGYTREALDEIRRCIEERGFIGIKGAEKVSERLWLLSSAVACPEAKASAPFYQETVPDTFSRPLTPFRAPVVNAVSRPDTQWPTYAWQGDIDRL